HIAGYSAEGKIAGTRMIADAIRVFQVQDGSSSSCNSRANVQAKSVNTTGPLRVPAARSLQSAVCAVVRSAYDILGDSRRLGEVAQKPATARKALVEKLRKEYPSRHEFASFQVEHRDGAGSDRAVAILKQLGFRA